MDIKNITNNFVFLEVEEIFTFLFPYTPWVRPFVDFTFYIFIELSRPLKLELFPKTCLVALESRYQQSARLLLLLFSKLGIIVAKKSTLSLASYSFISSSTTFTTSPSTFNSNAFSLIRDFANPSSLTNFFLKLKLL